MFKCLVPTLCIEILSYLFSQTRLNKNKQDQSYLLLGLTGVTQGLQVSFQIFKILLFRCLVRTRVSGTIVLSSQTKKFKWATTYSHYMDQKHYRNPKKFWKIIFFTLLKPIESLDNLTVLHYIPVYEWHFKEQYQN